jgi:hypothetical protein
VKPVPSVPLLSQTGTYTLEVTGSLPGDYYRWLVDMDTLLVRTATIKASRSGTYSAQSFIIYSPILTCSSALSTSLNFTVDITNQGLSVYPNPSPTKQVSVETLADLTDAVIRVYTLTGQEVAVVGVPVFRERQRLDFTTLANGMYILQVQAAGFVVAKRILIGVGN